MDAIAASVVVLAATLIALAFATVQIVGLQVAANAMQPDEDVTIVTAALVWLLGGVCSAGASCGLAVGLAWLPVVPLVVALVATVAVHTLVLAALAKIDLTRAFLAILAWVLAHLAVLALLWAVGAVGAAVVG